MSDQERLQRLLRARHTCICIPTHEEEYALRLIREVAMSLDRDLWIWTVIDGVRDGLIGDSRPMASTEHPAAALFQLRKVQFPAICVMLDLGSHLKDERTLRLLRELIADFEAKGSHLVLIDHQEEVPPVIAAYSTRFELSLPDEKELEGIIRDTLRRMHQADRIEVDITRKGLETIVRNLRGLSRRQAERVIFDVVSEDRRLDITDINSILARKRQTLHQGGLLEYIETPVDLDEIGGLSRLKSWLKKRQNALHEEALRWGLSAPRGVLMLGVQGAGKSLCAKAIATAWQQPLLRLDPGVLYDRYVGETERRLREALHQAETMAPIILWVDEVEKAFASAASRSTDGGLSQRMFGTLLTWMQEHTSPVFLVATANDIEALPPELLRKGRFDEIFFVDLPSEPVRKRIFQIHLKKRGREPEKFDLAKLAKASQGYSGAEIEQAVVSALHEAYVTKGELSTELILRALADSPPLSVTMAERVEALRAWARGRCVPAE